jgi:hypothetical protein
MGPTLSRTISAERRTVLVWSQSGRGSAAVRRPNARFARSGDASGKLYAVDVTPVKKLHRPVKLSEIKADTSFADFPLVRMSRLSVMPVTDAKWERIEKMSKT